MANSPFSHSAVFFCYSAAVFPQERELWAAVINRALDDLAESKKHVARDAHTWIFSPNKAVGSFIWICQHLDLEPNYIRRGIMQRIANAA